MKLNTTFWSKEVHSFDNILYINGATKEIIYETKLNDKFASYQFFKNIAKFVKTKRVRESILDYDRKEYFQFALMKDGEITPIKWFDLVINDNVVISHDIAFETTLIKKNNQRVGFGHFPMYYWNRNIDLPMYRELNVKARAYKYMANQIKKTWKD